MGDEANNFEEVEASLQRLLNYDLEKIHREGDLGAAFSFRAAMEPAQRVLSVFRRIPLSNLSELPENELKHIKSQADSFYNLLEQIQAFDHTLPEATTVQRDDIVNRISKLHQAVFTALMPHISYLTVRGTDFAGLESDARAAVQQAKDEANTAKTEIEEFAAQADESLRTIQATAAEMGVSQEALRFKEEADTHLKDATRWAGFTVKIAIALGLYAVASLFIHKWEFLTPANTYEAVQLALSKVLIFGVMSYMLFLSARNFLAHKHNAVVNRHRQNALITFKALVDAARIEEKQDIVLTHAADCIYSGRDTGFSRVQSQPAGGAAAVVQMLPRTLGGAASPE